MFCDLIRGKKDSRQWLEEEEETETQENYKSDTKEWRLGRNNHRQDKKSKVWAMNDNRIKRKRERHKGDKRKFSEVHGRQKKQAG